MAMSMGSLYEASVEGGASVDAAKKAVEVADHRKPLSDIRADLAVAKALLGVVVAGVAALVVHTFFV